MTAVIINLKFDNHKSYHNDEMIRHLINIHKIKYDYPMIDVCAKIDDIEFFKDNEKMYRILTSVCDGIIECGADDENILKKYTEIIDYDKIIKVDSHFDDNFHFYNLKKKLGPIVRNSLLFKEKDIDIMMTGGFNFDEKKIEYQKESNPKVKQICALYKVDCKEIKSNQIDYYHLSVNTQYRPFHLTQMFDNIEAFDYITPLKILSEYYDSNQHTYYEKLYKNVLTLSPAIKEKRLNLVDSLDPTLRDAIMSQYVKCRKNCFIISIWKPAIGGLNSFIDYLEKMGNIYYIKTITFTKKALRNLLFWMYDDFTYSARLEFIEKKLDYIDTLDENNEATFIIFDNINNHKLSGQGSFFKTELRNKLLEFAKLDKKRYRGNDLIHINDYFYQTVEYSQILLNDNSLNLLNHQDCRKYVEPKYELANLKIQTFRKMIYSNLSLLEIDRIIIMGGYVLYSYGIRPFTDIDAFIIKNSEDDKSTRYMTFIENNFVIEKSKLYYCDMGIQGSKYWRESWDVKNKMVYDFFNLENSEQMVLDPANYCYNQGFKVTIIDYEIIRKLMRNRTQDHVDLIMMGISDPLLIKDYIEIKDDNDDDDNKTKNGLDQYFNISEKTTKILGEYQNNDKKKYKILYDKYSKDDIEKAKKTKLFQTYFNPK